MAVHSAECSKVPGVRAYAAAVDGEGKKTIYRIAQCQCGASKTWTVSSIEAAREDEVPVGRE